MVYFLDKLEAFLKSVIENSSGKVLIIFISSSLWSLEITKFFDILNK